MDKLISVIVPVYNVEAYIEKCLYSIINQTYKNLEIILVDDGSPDNCGKICDDFSKLDKRIKVIHKKNGGLSDARNAGLDIASGDYIGFVDPDDWISPDMYEYMVQGMETNDVDIVTCDWYIAFPDNMNAARRSEDRLFVGREAMIGLLNLKFGNYAWNKLYKKELWDGIRYPVGKNYEDVRTTYKLVSKCKALVALKEAKYYYRQNENGIVREQSIKNKISCVESRMERYEILIEDYDEVKEFLLNEIYRYTLELRDVIFRKGKEDFEAQKDNLETVINFLNKYNADFLHYVVKGRLVRREFLQIKKGARRNWILSKFVSKIRHIKDRVLKVRLVQNIIRAKNGGLKKYIKKLVNIYQSDSALRYYEKCLQKLPLNEQMVLLESRGGTDLASNIYYVLQELTKKNLEIYVSAYEDHFPKIHQILKTGNFHNVTLITKPSKEYYRIFATAKYLFNDMVYNDRIVKREGQVWVNLWHGTPLKYLEFDVRNNRHELGGASREFVKTDYLVAPSQFMLEKLVDSAKVSNFLKKTHVLYSGYPRNQVFFDIQSRDEIRKELRICDKEVFIYMPTWRGTFQNSGKTVGEFEISNILDFFENALSDNQILFVKLHNLDKARANCNEYQKVKLFPEEYEPYAFLNIADCLITDYSSVFFDFANTRKKIILFTYDRASYLRDRGVYIELDSLPFPKVNTFEELQEELNLNKNYDDSTFRDRYCTYDCSTSAQKLVAHIIDHEYSCCEEAISPNNKKNILVYDPYIQFRSMESQIVEDYLEQLDTDDANYIYCYRQNGSKYNLRYLQKLDNAFGIYAITPTPCMTVIEKLYWKLFRKVPNSAIKREYARNFYRMPIDEVRVLEQNANDVYSIVVASLLQEHINN